MGRFRVKDVKRKGTCHVVALQYLGVLTDVTIKPGVHCGEVEVTCGQPRILCDGDDLPHHHHKAKGKSHTVRVFQELCIRVPIFYEAKADCEVRGITAGPIVSGSDECTGDDSSGSSRSTCCDSGTGSSDGSCDSGCDGSGGSCDSGSDGSGGSCDSGCDGSGGSCDSGCEGDSALSGDCSGGDSASGDSSGSSSADHDGWSGA